MPDEQNKAIVNERTLSVQRVALKMKSYSAVVHNVEGDRIPVVRDILRECEISEAASMKVCHMVENIENYEHIGTLDHQILIEAKLIVDFKEQNTPEKEIIRKAEDIFLTNTGKLFLKRAFNL